MHEITLVWRWRTSQETLFHVSSNQALGLGTNQSTVFSIFAHFDHFFTRSQCETLLCPASNQMFDFRTNECTVFFAKFNQGRIRKLYFTLRPIRALYFRFFKFRSTFFSRSQWKTLLCPASNQMLDFRTNERVASFDTQTNYNVKCPSNRTYTFVKLNKWIFENERSVL